MFCQDIGVGECDRIVYTLDGTDPTINSSVYSQPLEIVDDTELRFIAFDTAGNQSLLEVKNYSFDRVPPELTVTPLGGIFNEPLRISIICEDPGTIAPCENIYFTLDRSLSHRF